MATKRKPDSLSERFELKLIELLSNGLHKDEPCVTLFMDIEQARSAYKMPYDGLAYFTMKAVLGLPCLVELNTFTNNLMDVLMFFEDLLKMYMKSNETRTMCLKAVKDCCLDNPHMNQGEAAAYLIYSLHLQEIVTLHSVLEFLRELEETENPLMYQNSIQMLHGWLKQEAERAVSLPKKEDEEEEDRPICYWLDELPTSVLPRRYVWVRCEGASPFNPMFLWNAMDTYYQYMHQNIGGDGFHEREQYEREEHDEEEAPQEQGEEQYEGEEQGEKEEIPQGQGGEQYEAEEQDEKKEIPQGQGGEQDEKKEIPQGQGWEQYEAEQQDEKKEILQGQEEEQYEREEQGEKKQIPQGQGGEQYEAEEQDEKKKIPQRQGGEKYEKKEIPQGQEEEQYEGEEQGEKEKIPQGQGGKHHEKETIHQASTEQTQLDGIPLGQQNQGGEQGEKEEIPRGGTPYEGEGNIPQEGEQYEGENKVEEEETPQKGEQYEEEERDKEGEMFQGGKKYEGEKQNEEEEKCEGRNEKVNNMREKNKVKKRKCPKVNKIREKNN